MRGTRSFPLAIIFVIDENGEQVKKSRAWIDGKLKGDDALKEIVALHRCNLGEGKAESITFVSTVVVNGTESTGLHKWRSPKTMMIRHRFYWDRSDLTLILDVAFVLPGCTSGLKMS